MKVIVTVSIEHLSTRPQAAVFASFACADPRDQDAWEHLIERLWPKVARLPGADANSWRLQVVWGSDAGGWLLMESHDSAQVVDAKLRDRAPLAIWSARALVTA